MPHSVMSTTVMIEQIQLRSFRSFTEFSVSIRNQILLIEGINGSGKTSLLEALYYACYLRSFRTHIQKELLNFESDTFFIRLSIHKDLAQHQIQIGFSNAKRIVRVDEKAVSSYKQLMSYYRVVSITEDDLSLVKGAPEVRRTFIDQAILLANPDYIHTIKKMRQILENRNSLLRTRQIEHEIYKLWTEQLWEISKTVQDERIKMLALLSKETNSLLQTHFDPSLEIKFSYRNKNLAIDQKTDNFDQITKDLLFQEVNSGRSIFGSHLDDFEIVFKGHNSRIFASRGQQKLILFLIKIAQVQLLTHRNDSAVILIDDFMTDFDQHRVEQLISLLVTTQSQLIFTCPTSQSFLRKVLDRYTPQLLNLTV